MSKQKQDNQAASPIGVDSPTPPGAAPPPSAEPTKDAERGRQSDDRRPLCPYHHKPCTAQRSDAFFTRYYCTEEGCTFSTKVARPQILQRVRQAEERDRERPPR